MSPRSDSGRSATSQQRSQPSRSASQPYPASSSSRRPSSHAQPKSSRQQFSACGACRMRRVKCDLKDLQATNPGQSSCSNCHERNLKCVDEFAEVKAVKLLRRGRRLQQVEAVYGKAAVGAEADRSFSQLPIPQCSIPMLHAEFFTSAFYHRLLVQRPILDPLEFAARFNNADPEELGDIGRLICLVLSTWAASFGVNEKGEPERHTGYDTVKVRRERTNAWVHELLRMVDHYGLLRRPTWDGVQVLLLLLPLTEDMQTSLERLAVYETAINQVYMLCSLTNTSSVRPATRARIFWYAHVHEGLTTGIRGGRLLLTMDDLDAFQATVPHINDHVSLSQDALALSVAIRFSKTPLRVSEACRTIHGYLTGPRARQRAEINEACLRNAWNFLHIAWDELDALRHSNAAGFIQPDDVDVFAQGWQIMIFECHNVIRDALRQRVNDSEKYNVSSAQLRQIRSLYAEADHKCRELASLVVGIVRQQLDGPLFEFDASLVRDGCFFAANLLANDINREDEAEVCIRALRKMRWAFCKSEERENTLRMALHSRLSGGGRRMSLPSLRTGSLPAMDNSGPASTANSPCSSVAGSSRTPPQHNLLRSAPPPLILTANGTMVESGPNTAVTDDGSWPSMSHCSSTSASISGSPPFIAGKPDPSMGTSAMLFSESTLPMSSIESSTASLYVTDMEYPYSTVPSTSDRHGRSTPLRTPTAINSFNDPYFDTATASVFGTSGLDNGSSQGADIGPSYHTRFGNSPSQFFVSP